jgi:hypothetical protein
MNEPSHIKTVFRIEGHIKSPYVRDGHSNLSEYICKNISSVSSLLSELVSFVPKKVSKYTLKACVESWPITSFEQMGWAWKVGLEDGLPQIERTL